jgi:hypothetical protein
MWMRGREGQELYEEFGSRCSGRDAASQSQVWTHDCDKDADANTDAQSRALCRAERRIWMRLSIRSDELRCRSEHAAEGEGWRAEGGRRACVSWSRGMK